MKTQDAMKQEAALAALQTIHPFLQPDSVIGVGTGSTANYFIDALATIKGEIQATVASSEATAERLRGYGLPVWELNTVDQLEFYIDGADEVNPALQLIKGGGGALTREKIVATVANEFICIIDETKLVDELGAFPLPVEVIPMARSHVGRELAKLGADPVYRQGVLTDNGNIILDMFNFPVANPLLTEQAINGIVGVVTNGLFAAKPASRVLIAGQNGVRSLGGVIGSATLNAAPGLGNRDASIAVRADRLRTSARCRKPVPAERRQAYYLLRLGRER